MEPLRKLRYNMAVTLVSAAIALLVGGIEALGLLQGQFRLSGPIWDGIGILNGILGVVGYLIIGIFIAALVASTAMYRFRRSHRLEIEAG